MARKLSGQMMLSANRLADGRVVYLGADGWTTEFGRARVIGTADEAEAAEAAGAWAVAGGLVVDPYLIEVAAAPGGGIEPARLRERIRRCGPTAGNSAGRI